MKDYLKTIKVNTQSPYKVVIDDCCVEGEFISKVESITNSNGLPVLSLEHNDFYGSTVKFYNGVMLVLQGGVCFYYI